MYSPALLDMLRCPTDHSHLAQGDGALVCTQCGEKYPLRDGYVEVLPREEFERTTRYTDAAGEAVLDYREIGPPLLSAKIKNDSLNDFLNLGPGDRVLDLGCGNGKFAYWNRGRVESIIGLDVSPWFADAARRELPLLRGDIRALPFDDGAFDKVYSIDVLEHLTLSDIARVLEEVRRKLKPSGRFFVFSNTRERQTLAWAMAPQRAMSDWLRRRGVVDFRRDDWRKSDHIKAITTFEELQATCAAHGFKIVRIVFWNGFFQGWIENVIVKLGEALLSRRQKGLNALEREAAARHEVRASLTSAGGKRFYVPLALLTALMSLDLRLFGRLRAGPYFALLERGA